jgi:DNA-binding SARP family transcriptional activator/TolB-like protein
VRNNRESGSTPFQRRFNAASTPFISATVRPKALRLRTFGGLWIENPDGGGAAGLRPRPLALLAILATSGAKAMSRDHVLGVLWPETEEDRARQSLSQAIYSLRRDLGLEVADSTAGLRLDPNQITSDVAEFRAAVSAKRWGEAAGLYTGAFLDGFYLADAPEFERWVEGERAFLATEGIRAIENAAKASDAAGHREEAAEHWHRLTRLDPTSSRIATAYMQALEALGDRAAALAHGRAHAELLRRELEVEPDQAFGQVMARLRQADGLALGGGKSGLGTGDSALGSAKAPVTALARDTAPTVPPNGARWTDAMRRRATVLALSVVAVLAGGAFALRWSIAKRPNVRPVLAVGRIRDLAAPDSAALGAVLSEMLATSLGRLNELQVIANSRMLELTPRDADTSRTALTDAARRAGATEIIEGELMPLAGGRLRLEVRRVEIARGLVRGGYRVSGSDRVALFDSVTTLIAGALRVDAPTGSLAEVTTRSPVAYRFYEEGLRAFYQYDTYAANRLFQSAVREDSTFAMAAYYAWHIARSLQDPNDVALAALAVQLASHAPPRERLLILAHVGFERADLRAVAAAESLATGYPSDPEAIMRAAEVIEDLPRATELINRSIALDSAATPASSAVCRLCDALRLLTIRYEWADSSDAVLRTLARWHALRPNDPAAWAMEADWLTALGHGAEADAAIRRYYALGGKVGGLHVGALVQSLRLDNYDAADRACAEGLTGAGDQAAVTQYRWYCAIALRAEGRYREAVALVHEGRVPRSAVVKRGLPRDSYLLGVVDMEAGRPRVAADEFLDIAAHAGRETDTLRVPAGLQARNLTWPLVLSATAAVAGGDTTRARRLVDTIETVGQRSLFARDPRLHHFVRGLLHSRAQQHEAAVREFHAAISSPTFGYTRINYELARSLLALTRAGEAIPLLQAALRGGIEGSGLYITRTELHELLAQSFDANHQRDSASVHYAVVARAWASADPFLVPRRDAARRGLRLR